MSATQLVYLDHNATAPLLPEVWEALQAVAPRCQGNPSSPHRAGREARAVLEDARRRIAAEVGVPPQSLCFTSGGSESNNAVLRQFAESANPVHLVVSAVEHPSVLETARALAQRPNLSITELPVNAQGLVSPESLAAALRPETTLVSVMSANNETGALQPLTELVRICQARGVRFHTDATQVFGKLLVDWSGVDFATATAHKLGGPRGIGLLYVRPGTSFVPQITGGRQERVRRAGTENDWLAHGFAEAVAWHSRHREQMQAQWAGFRKRLLDGLQDVDGFFLNSPDAGFCLAHTLNFGFRGLSGESLVIALDLEGIAVSTGSACSSGALEASPVLLAQGRNRKDAKASLRISFGAATTAADVALLLARLRHHVRRLHSKRTSKP